MNLQIYPLYICLIWLNWIQWYTYTSSYSSEDVPNKTDAHIQALSTFIPPSYNKLSCVNTHRYTSSYCSEEAVNRHTHSLKFRFGVPVVSLVIANRFSGVNVHIDTLSYCSQDVVKQTHTSIAPCLHPHQHIAQVT